MKNLLVYLSLIALLSCGAENKKSGSLPVPTVSEDTSENFYVGSVYLNTVGSPGANFTLFLLNHTKNTFVEVPVSPSGAYSISTRNLRRFENYSLQLVDDNHLYVGAATIEGSELFNFSGGAGASLQDLIVVRDSFGVVDTGTSTFEIGGTLAGDLGLAAAVGNGLLSDFTPPTLYSNIKVGANLVVDDKNELLTGFYRAGSNPDQYSESIQNWSGFRISSELASETNKTMFAGILKTGSNLVRSGRVRTSSTTPNQQPTWSSKGYALTIVDNKVDTTIYPLKVPGANEFVSFDLVFYAGLDTADTITTNFLGRVGLSLSMPPLITGINQGSSTTVAIDYSGDVLENGLSVPFCRTTGDVYFEMSAPTDFDSTDITYTDFSQATVRFDYYYESSGRTVLAELETNEANDPLVTSDYPTGFTTEFLNGSLAYATRRWKPHDQSIVFDFTNASSSIATHNLQLFGSVFINNIASLSNAPVTQTRLTITYEGPKHRTGIVTYFRNCL